MRVFVFMPMVFVAGCATGVVQTGADTYMVGRTSAGGGFATAAGPKADAYADAVAFCREKGLEVETISVDAKDGRVFVRPASAELQFRCAPKK